jgi:DNA-binding CsgD family transcriptional regulator
MMQSYRLTEAAQSLTCDSSRLDPCEPSLDNPRFELLLLRLHAAIDVAGFWAAVQSILDETVPHDACVVYVDFVDFSHTWTASQILATPTARKPTEWLERRREVDLMPAFILAHPGLKNYRLSDVVPDSRELQGSEFFRRYMAPEGWHHTACSLFWQERGLVSEIALRRTTDQGDFTTHEMALLNRLHPHFETALQRLSALKERSEPSHTVSQLMALARLTPAESELARLVLQGRSNKEIAGHLDKSIRTVKNQLTSVYRKCGVESRSRLLVKFSPHL